MELEVEPDLQKLRQMRRSVREGLIVRGIDDATIETTLLVLDEIVSNSIEHGNTYRTTFPPLVVRLQVTGLDVVLDFFDPEVPAALVVELAAALLASRGQLPPVDSERGRGMFLVSTFLLDLVIDHAVGGGLHLRGRLAGGPA